MAIVGYVEHISTTQVRGWVHDPDHAGLKLRVAVWLQDRELAHGAASQFRRDLADAGVGNGDHAFAVDLAAVTEADLPSLTVRASAGDGPASPVPKLPPLPDWNPIPRAEHRRAAPAGEFVPDTAHYPVFVLGAARSGTSAVAQALLKSGFYDGFEEGHALALLARQLLTIRDYYRDNGEETLPSRATMLAQIPQAYFRNTVLNSFKDLVPHLFDAKRWVDKTPSAAMVEASPFFREVWPNAKFIFMKRRALENVDSRLKKFPQIPFDDHCADWVRVMSIWLAVKPAHRAAAIEVDQFDMATRPGQVADTIARFLAMPPHVAERIRQSLTTDRSERTSRVFGAALSLATVDWSAEQKAAFRRTCGPLMAQYGYSMDADYTQGPP